MKMIQNGVWRKVKKEHTNGRKLVGNRWVFEVKRDGTYRARLVAQGYSQVPGVDFTTSHSPVSDEVILRLLIAKKGFRNLKGMTFDVETAFLYGKIQECIFMKIPEGFAEVVDYIDADDEALKVDGAMYGLVQAAREWWNKFCAIMKKKGYERCAAAPCLFKKQTKSGPVFITLYVDDGFMIAHGPGLEEASGDLKSSFKMKFQAGIQEYVGCNIFEICESKVGFIQPHLIQKMFEKFKDELPERNYETPFAPNSGVNRELSKQNPLAEEQQKDYRSGVRMLLYLVKYSRPDIANGVRELSKVMDAANHDDYERMLRMIKFVVSTKNKCLVMNFEKKKENGNVMQVKAFCDSDYAGDKETRKSVSGFMIYINGVPISWKSKGQKTVTLSSTEAEYIALSDLICELKYLYQVLEFLEEKVELPMIVHMDNVSAIYLSKNWVTGGRTKHIDIRHHFVREYQEDGMVKIIFVAGTDNDADLFTKNLPKEVFEKHSNKSMETVKEKEDENNDK
jgi:hypothetical protein